MKYAIIGSGAIGSYYGGKLCRAGQDVHFLFHSDYEYVCKHGLQVNSCNGSFHLDNIQAYNDVNNMPKCDVIIVALKTTRNGLLKEMLPPLLHNKSIVLLIQNGIGVEDDVQAMFPNAQLAAGLAFICSAKTKPGVVDHQCYGSINIGNFSCKDINQFNQMLADFQDAGVEAQEVEYNEARWKKAVWNMPFNGMTVALNTQTNLLLKNPSTMQLIREQMLEVIHAANYMGINIPESFADKMIENTLNMVPYSPSMKLDYEFNRPMEIEYLYTRPIEIARKAGFRMPKLEMLEAELRFLEV